MLLLLLLNRVTELGGCCSTCCFWGAAGRCRGLMLPACPAGVRQRPS